MIGYDGPRDGPCNCDCYPFQETGRCRHTKAATVVGFTGYAGDVFLRMAGTVGVQLAIAKSEGK
jgi:hypothetical protein